MSCQKALSVLKTLFDKHDLRMSCFIEWSEHTRPLLKTLSELGPEFLGDLVREASDDHILRSRFETHQLLDYLVLYEDKNTGVRLRLHIATKEHLQRMHDHRFSFSTLIFTGHYQHCLYGLKQNPYEISSLEEARSYQDRFNPDPKFAGLTSDDLFQIEWIRNETAGSSYSLHHSQAHTVFTSKNTVSLVLRGPIEKPRSLIFEQKQQQLWWRFGREEESGERISQKIMSPNKLEEVIQNLTELEIIL